MTFKVDLEQFARKTSNKADAVVRKIVLDVGTALVMKSPVGDASYWKEPSPPGYVGGRFRANWQYGDEIPHSALNDIDPNGYSTIGRITEGVGINAAGKLHFLVNRLPYGPRLEDGWSRQAPQGMVHLTVLEFQNICAMAAREIAR